MNRLAPTIRPNLSALLIECQEGGFTAICPQIRGAVSEGETEDEACANLADAVQEILAANEQIALESLSEDCAHPRSTEHRFAVA